MKNLTLSKLFIKFMMKLLGIRSPSEEALKGNFLINGEWVKVFDYEAFIQGLTDGMLSIDAEYRDLDDKRIKRLNSEND